MVEESKEVKHGFYNIMPMQNGTNNEAKKQMVEKLLALAMAYEPEEVMQQFALYKDRLSK